jgi:hypothetical protein
MIRPEAAATLRRWRDVILGVALGALGLWMVAQPGFVLPALGAVLVALGLGLAVVGMRRIRLAGVQGPGVVQVVEGQVAYFGPTGGGFVALDDLTLLASDREDWVLTGADGSVLRVPRGAQGVEALTDALVRLPGLDPAALLRRGGAAAAGPQRIWRRPGAVAPLTWADQRDRSGGS